MGELLQTITPVQEVRNNILLNSAKLASFRNFLSEQYHYLYGLVELYRIPPKGTKCNWCVMVAHLDNYLKSTNYKDQCKWALGVVEMDSDHKRVCTSLCFSILARIVQDIRHNFEEICTNNEIGSLDDVELNVLRYVQWCLHPQCHKGHEVIS